MILAMRKKGNGKAEVHLTGRLQTLERRGRRTDLSILVLFMVARKFISLMSDSKQQKQEESYEKIG
ncbi:MAG: hypothetical protein LUC83_11400 [Clostridiales bacterium]|nr:hypothetical protein [Clostridiales bacterium]